MNTQPDGRKRIWLRRLTLAAFTGIVSAITEVLLARVLGH